MWYVALSSQSIPPALRQAACALALSVALPAFAAPAYQFRQVIPGLVASPTPQSQEPVAALLVALSAGNLPAAMVGQPYGYDLKQLLSVTGESSPDKSAATWSVVAGALPTNLTLSGTGVISGTPTTKNEAGASFEVKASYKGTDGQQVYVIVVNGAVLQVTQVAVGDEHTCALTPTGSVKCWGNNDNGQLGNGTIQKSSSPVAVSNLAGVTQLSAGGFHTCALTATGAWCWGNNAFGQLGDGTTTGRKTPGAVPGLSTGVANIYASGFRTCALTTAGGAKCWGYGYEGQVGDGSTGTRTSPANVTGLTSGVTSLGVGPHHACATLTTGEAKCWGYNPAGQLGDGTTTTRTTPVTVKNLPAGIAYLSPGYYHTCALTTAGGVFCWGDGGAGQLGHGGYGAKTTPTAVSGLTSGVSQLAGIYNHSCAVTSAGAALCWGTNQFGQVGAGLADTSVLSPVVVQGLNSGVLHIGGSIYHTCASTSTGMKCWGKNHHGQLGDGTTTNSATPVSVTP